MKRSVSLFLAVALTAACTDHQVEGGAATDSPTATASAAATASASATAATSSASATQSPGGGARAVSEETDDFVFNYAYPAEAGKIPALATLLDSKLERERSSLAEESAKAREDARDNGFPYNKYSSGMKWKLVANLPDWLSLSGEVSSYTGGAHGNYGVVSLVWDKQAEKAMDGVDLFSSAKALGDALGQRYCNGLDAQRRKKRGPEPVAEGDTIFSACPKVGELSVLLGSSNKRTFNRLTLYAGPYVAGPYVEGAYEVNLDVDKAVIGAVKPEYRASFSVRR